MEQELLSSYSALDTGRGDCTKGEELSGEEELRGEGHFLRYKDAPSACSEGRRTPKLKDFFGEKGLVAAMVRAVAMQTERGEWAVVVVVVEVVEAEGQQKGPTMNEGEGRS